MFVRKIIKPGAELTEEQKARLAALKNMRDENIVFDEDCPELTEEELRQFKRVNTRRKPAGDESA